MCTTHNNPYKRPEATSRQRGNVIWTLPQASPSVPWLPQIAKPLYHPALKPPTLSLTCHGVLRIAPAAALLYSCPLICLPALYQNGGLPVGCTLCGCGRLLGGGAGRGGHRGAGVRVVILIPLSHRIAAFKPPKPTLFNASKMGKRAGKK